MLAFSEHTGEAQIDCASAFLQVVAVLYVGAFTLIKSLCKKCKLIESCLGNSDITVGGDIDSEDDFLIDSRKM